MRDRSRESGAILILALLFMLAGSLLVVPLAGLASTNLGDTPGLVGQRQVQYAADGASELAIEQIRYSKTQGYPHGSCTLNPNTFTLNGYSIRVDCTSNVPVSGSGQSRNVSFVACPTTHSATNCPGFDLLDAQEAFSDFNPSGQVQIGYSAALLSWIIKPANS